MTWLERADAELASIEATGRRRSLRVFDAHGPTGALGGRPVTSYASNDYLGLSAHPDVIEAAAAASRRWGTGATASRLVVGTRPAHADLEADYAASKGTEAALVLSSGYAANLAVLTTFGSTDVTIVSDERNHASIIDGCRLAKAASVIYRHNDVDQLRARVVAAPGPVIVVTDSVFSMDGDVAPLTEIADVCRERGALLVVDEAHAALGPEVPLDLDVLRVGTLSKTLGSLGGIVAGPSSMIDLLVNRARSFIFSTGLPPSDTAAAHAALAIVDGDEGDRLRSRLRSHVDRLVPGHPSPIVPIVLGDEAVAMDASAALLDRGILVPAIRPPTVAPGTSRLRVALSAAHTDAMVDELVEALTELGIRP